jgi:hypothetical protein
MWPSAMPAYYLIATGAPAVSMVSVGLVTLPRMIGEQKTEGSLTCMRSLPVQAMGEVTRGTIAPNQFPASARCVPDARGVVRARLRGHVRGHGPAALMAS